MKSRLSHQRWELLLADPDVALAAEAFAAATRARYAAAIAMREHLKRKTSLDAYASDVALNEVEDALERLELELAQVEVRMRDLARARVPEQAVAS